MARTEIRVVGFGGQGVVMMGHVIGHACAINAGMHATMIQSFGPEARGSACSSTVAVSPEEVLYPYITQPDILVVMSAEGYSKYWDELKPKGILVYENELVHPDVRPDQPSFGVPSTRIAEALGRKIVQNSVMLGFFAAATELVPREALRSAVEDSVPHGTEELNLKAFDAGWNHFTEEYGAKQPSRKKESTAAK
ncbi:2-oxoacid:acceptor oxidoreductase family protein [bacterium]|nr:2-oxoacid:acceptor oxidoreductase family protein [bacterium]